VKDDILILFGSRIRELRLAKEMSQEAFAEKCGLHRNYIGMVERGERNVSLKNIAKMTKALNIDIVELFK
jgi:transcriptional regulator with XRE-family HTH domain